jgi:hypothetical protein
MISMVLLQQDTTRRIYLLFIDSCHKNQQQKRETGNYIHISAYLLVADFY